MHSRNRVKRVIIYWCAALCCTLVIGYSIGEPSRDPDVVSVAGLPSSSDQAKVLSQSKQYIQSWIDGDLQKIFSLLYSETVWAIPGHKKHWLQYLVHQRRGYSYISSTDKPEGFHCLSMSYEDYGKLLATCLAANSTANVNSTGQYDAGMHLAMGRIVTVQFSLHQKKYYQVWIVDKSQSWKCINFPVDLDQKTLQQIKAWK